MENAAPSLFPSLLSGAGPDTAPEPTPNIPPGPHTPPEPAPTSVPAPSPLADLPAALRRELHRGLPCAAGAEAPAWSLASLTGRLCELGGAHTPRLTLAASLVLEAQHEGQPVAWVTPVHSCFHPPDLAATGVDLEALPVVRVDDALAGARAADHLLRSGAFGLVVLDLPVGEGVPLPAQTRLAAMVRRHRSVLLCLSRGARPRRDALGSLVSWRGEGAITRVGPGRFRATLEVTKDKRSGPGARVEVVRRGPDGLC